MDPTHDRVAGGPDIEAPQDTDGAEPPIPNHGSSRRFTPEEMRQQAHRLSLLGERREAADLLRLAVHAAEEQHAGPRRLIPLVESLAEVLWQLNEKREARLYGNRALHLYFAARG